MSFTSSDSDATTSPSLGVNSAETSPQLVQILAPIGGVLVLISLFVAGYFIFRRSQRRYISKHSQKYEQVRASTSTNRRKESNISEEGILYLRPPSATSDLVQELKQQKRSSTIRPSELSGSSLIASQNWIIDREANSMKKIENFRQSGESWDSANTGNRGNQIEQTAELSTSRYDDAPVRKIAPEAENVPRQQFYQPLPAPTTRPQFGPGQIKETVPPAKPTPISKSGVVAPILPPLDIPTSRDGPSILVEPPSAEAKTTIDGETAFTKEFGPDPFGISGLSHHKEQSEPPLRRSPVNLL